MEMNLLGKIVINSRAWGFFNKKFVMPLIFNNLLKNRYERVLDLGCGVGYTTEEISLRLRDSKVYGVDYDRKQIEKAFLKKSERITFLVGDGANLKFDSNYFDAVFAIEVMHHIENYEKAIKEVYRVLKNNGDFYILEANERFLKNPLIRLIDNTQSFFSMKEFINKLEGCGFKIYKQGKTPLFFYVVARKLGQEEI